MNNNIIKKPKNIDLIKEGTDNILEGLSEEDKMFVLSITSSLVIFKPQVVTKKVVENLTKMYACKTSVILEYINKLIKYYYYNLPKGFKRVPNIDYVFCNENDEMIHFLRRYITMFISPKGYANISINGSRSYHRIIALTWIPNPDNKPQVNHIDGVKLNNKVSNLEWNTSLENIQHASRTGLLNTPAVKANGNGEKNSQAILKVSEVINIRKTVTETLEQTKTYLCKTFNIDLNTLEDVLIFKNKVPIPIQYKYRSFESKLSPGKVITVGRRLYRNDESAIRGMFFKIRNKIMKKLSLKYKISKATINDIIARRSWNYDYC